MRPGDWAWIALAAGVVAWDAACPVDEMLSDAALRYVRARPAVANTVIAVTALHLAGRLPACADPLHLAGVAWRRLRDRVL